MKKIVALLLSLLIMGVIFMRIDLGKFQGYFSRMSIGLCILAILFFIPQVLITAYRWQYMIRRHTPMALGESVRLILSCCALNILLPSRIGDLSKAYFVGREGKVAYQRATNVVFFEKYIDLASLGVVILTGIFWSRQWDQATFLGLVFSGFTMGLFPVLCFLRLDQWLHFSFLDQNRLFAKLRSFLLDTQAYLDELKGKRGELIWVLLLSVGLWFLHLLQFYVFFRALHSEISLFHIFRLVPLAILVGLVPITLAGVGTRDSAMIYFFSPYEDPSLIVGVGLFSSLRYFVPGILGLPFLNRYLVKNPQR